MEVNNKNTQRIIPIFASPPRYHLISVEKTIQDYSLVIKTKGLKFLDHLGDRKDSSGTSYETHFLALPDPIDPKSNDDPELPISLGAIRVKLNNLQYSFFRDLESDVRRMIATALELYPEEQVICEHAQILSQVLLEYKVDNQWAANDLDHSTRVLRIRAAKIIASKMASGNTYAGLSFQQAQEKIIEDTIEYQESPDDAIPTFADFIDLPPRSLKDYYATIQHPLSLKSLLKAVKGTSSSRSRSSSGGTSPFLTWPQFEKEISYIWVNTFEYNLDDSEIYARGKQLEIFIKKALKEAKQAVADTTGQSSGPKIKLNLTRKAPHDSPAPEASSPVSNGAPTNGTGRSSKRLRTGTPASAVDQPESAKSVSDTVASPAPSSAAAPMKTEEIERPPSQAASTPGVAGSGMPPPSAASHMLQQAHGAYAQAVAHSHHTASTTMGPDSGLDYSRFRTSGQTMKDALITNVVIASHPGLNTETQFVHDMTAWNRVRQPHFTFHLSGVYNYIQIKPILADGLIDRQHKMYVMINNQILQAMPMIPGHPMDPLRPLFETRLEPGTSRIDIQIRATLPSDAPRGPHGEDFEDEYWVICPNLRRI